MLFLVNALNFFDRQVIAAVVEPLRREWSLTDAQIGAIGTAFTLLYAVVGLPLGRLADTWSRRALLFAGCFLWTSMTALSALATGFRTLFAARLAVGVGEAVCAPASTSLLADLFPSERRGRATSVFMLGLPVGLGLSYAVSGAVAQAWGWRAAFLVAGLPGVLVALLCLTLPEPPRGAAEGAAVGSRRRPGSVVALLARTPTFLWIVVSGALHNFNMYALSLFLPALLTRRHGLDLREAGIVSGLVFGVVGGIGMLLGGWTSDRAAAWRADGRLLTCAVGLGLAVPMATAFLGQAPGARASTTALLCLTVLLLYLYYAPVYATLQDIVEPSLRGTAMAVYFFAMYLLGASLGPWGTGLLSDALAARAAAESGALLVDERARAVGLHQALYVVPVLSALLSAVLFAASRTVERDRAALRDWISLTTKDLHESS
ncbi:MAG TPA: MFS transporter [Vicinamibacteria bacterium]|nr:MFS transporter [Vicinamibacteria bacterium]